MRKGFWVFTIVVLFIGLGENIALGQEKEIEEMKRKIEVLTEEVEKIKLGAVAEPTYERFKGLGPAASKVYFVDKGLSIGGYGEVVYSNYMDSSKKDIADTYRFILYGGYKFNEWIVMNTELEFEHAGIKNVGSRNPEVYVEFSYLDFLLSKPFNLRTGLLLVPIGIINEFHEPTVYQGVYRPEVETNIIPSTWREIGVMAYGEPIDNLTYKVALTNGLRADLFSKSTWLRSGRQQGAEVNADVGALVGNVNYEIIPGVAVGGSYYWGQAASGKGGDSDTTTGQKEGEVNLFETHADFRWRGLEVRGLYAVGELEANEALQATGVGKEVEGWYLQAAYDILPLIKSGSEMGLSPFIRYEDYNTHKQTFSGSPDKTLDRTVTTIGVSFNPHPNVVIKADYQWKDTESDLPEGKGSGFDENKIDQFNLGIGFIF